MGLWKDCGGWTELAAPALGIFAVIVLGVAAFVLVTTEPGAWNKPAPINMTYYPEPVAKAGYVLTKEEIGGRTISSYLLSSQNPGAEPRPAVILIHGGGIVDPMTSSKPQYKGEWFIPLFEGIPYRLAAGGILVVAIDAWWAGERHRPEHRALAQANPIAAIFHGYVETSHDVSEVIDYLVAREDVDPTRIGVAGKSGGGIISLMAACNDDRIEAVVAWKAGADFVQIAHLRGEDALIGYALNHDAAFREELQQFDPIYRYERIPPKALAFVGNYEDPLMPRQGAQGLYDKLLPAYADFPERLMITLLETPKPTHDLGPEAFRLGCEWFEQFLTGTRHTTFP
jgi:dienelactone hydrolase